MRYSQSIILLVTVIASIAPPIWSHFVGSGIADITGPANDEGMMGYAQFDQITTGIHFRQYARCFVFVDKNGSRFCHCTCDLAMIFRSVKAGVVDRLKAVYGNGVYDHHNIMLSAIHTHSGPGGFAWNVIYDITTLGFDKKALHAIIDGIVSAIQAAHDSVRPNIRLRVIESTLDGVTISRSPTSYTANPPEERAKYKHDTDKTYVLVRMETEDGTPIGLINWFAVHGVSMPNWNHLISGDNKGIAAARVEAYFNGPDVLPATGKFVAAFANANEGDATPNIEGAFCKESGKPCDLWHSTCSSGGDMGCHGMGPGWQDYFKSTWVIGDMQYNKTLDMMEAAATAPIIDDIIDIRHMYVDFSNLTVSGNFTTTGVDQVTCKPAFGYSMAAGTTDGPGAWGFFQGDNSSTNAFVKFVMDFFAKPSPELVKCQHPKPVLFDLAETKIPWAPSVIPVQLARIGQVYIIGPPVELTTMSGRRLRDTVRDTLVANGAVDPIVVISGLSNEYIDYCATYEEYQYQRYEGGSTAYGPNSLAGYQQEFARMAESMMTGTPLPPDAKPLDWDEDKLWSFFSAPIADEHPIGHDFGTMDVDVLANYTINSLPIVTCVVWGAQLRNNYMDGSTFLEVQRKDKSGNWVVYKTDAHWETRILWKRHHLLESKITIEWQVTDSDPPGTYRIMHQGYAKPLLKYDPVPYSGFSSEFVLC